MAFLNDEVWNLSNVQQGKYLYILFPTDLNFWLEMYLVFSSLNSLIMVIASSKCVIGTYLNMKTTM